MINITDKQKCCGCRACVNICPENCIEMIADNEGFLYPEVDVKKCINCNACEKVCHYLGSADAVKKEHKPELSAACFINDSDELMKSASGGIASEISRLVIENGGVVFGVTGNAIDGVKHTIATEIAELEPLKNSKYLQSDIGYTYKEVKEKLLDGNFVFFTGTPCQVAGLYGFLGKDYDSLLTGDLICHGVPSEKVFKKYIKEHEEKIGKKVVSFFRDKSAGWKPVKFSYIYDDGSKITHICSEDIFNMGFTTNLFQRPSCYSCPYVNENRIGDITLGDWLGGIKYKTLDPNNKGLSMISINSSKGKKIYEAISGKVTSFEYDVAEALKEGPHFRNAPHMNYMRRDFFKNLDKKTYHDLYKRFYPKNKGQKLINAFLRRFYKLKYKNSKEKFFN